MAYQTEPGGLGDKFRLLYTVATDSRASRAHAAVMAVILWRFNRAHGCCWPSIDSLAEDSGLDTRTVQRALDSLEEWGFLHTLRQRGKLNRYVPHFQAQREPLSNGVRAAPQREKGRHSRPRGTTFPSQSNGLHAVPPTACTPPEYLNESITEKEKEKREAKGTFSVGGNQETVGDSGTSDAHAGGSIFPKGSAERRVEIGLTILSVSQGMGLGRGEYQHRLAGIREEYLNCCVAELREPDPRAIALIEDREPFDSWLERQERGE